MERGRTGKNILIVEDHVLFAEMLAVMLTRAFRSPGEPEKPGNFPKFYHAGSIAEALRLVSRDRPLDLAVVDLMLPDGNGATVVGEIKRRSPGTPVAVLTASQDLSEALAAGADKAMPKTTSLEEMVACLVRLARVPDQPGTQDT
jgi:DNA-binding NarL/FixJ family response regulator